LGGEGDADGSAGAEEIAEGAGGNAELFVAGDGRGFGASRTVEAERVALVRLLTGVGSAAISPDVIVAGILAIEEIEKFREGPELETLAKINVAADAKIDLVKRSAAKLIEGSLHAVDDGAVVAGKAVVQNVGGGAQRERAGAFKLRRGWTVRNAREVAAFR